MKCFQLPALKMDKFIALNIYACILYIYTVRYNCDKNTSKLAHHAN